VYFGIFRLYILLLTVTSIKSVTTGLMAQWQGA
jgi:hypothetical protein